jgi:hypothetical protein
MRWAEKSPANVFYFDRIREHFHERVRLIQIVRDGRDVVLSEHPSKPGEQWVPVQRWKAAVTAGLDCRNVLTVMYQDLVLDFQAQIERICAFIGEPVTPELLDWHRHATVRTSRNLIGHAVPMLHADSIRKFERPGCKHAERAAALMDDPEARELLAAYGFAA